MDARKVDAPRPALKAVRSLLVEAKPRRIAVVESRTTKQYYAARKCGLSLGAPIAADMKLPFPKPKEIARKNKVSSLVRDAQLSHTVDLRHEFSIKMLAHISRDPTENM